MIAKNLLWWFLYTAAAIWLQACLPGLDAFLPGLLLSLQEQRWQQTAWLAIAALLVQEGTGTLAFGVGILWYGILIVIFIFGRHFFVTSSLVFVLMLAAAMGGAHAVILYALSSLQHLSLSLVRLMEQSLAQILLVPPLWGTACLIRTRVMRHADTV